MGAVFPTGRRGDRTELGVRSAGGENKKKETDRGENFLR